LLHTVQGTNFADDFIAALEELNAKSSGDVEWDMAMHEPGAWVVGLECKHEVAACRESSSVTTDRVVSFEARNVAAPFGVFSLVEDVEVVAVEMDRVGKRRGGSVVLLDDPVLPLFLGRVSICSKRKGSLHEGNAKMTTYLVLLADFEHMTVGCKGVVAFCDALQGRVVEIDHHGNAVDEPLNEVATTRCVGKSDLHLLGHVLWHVGFDVGHDCLIVATCCQGHRRCGAGIA
jgi:hypothetical protein